YSSDEAAALQWVYTQRDAFSIAAANLSFGGGGYTSTCDSDVSLFTNWAKTLRSVGIATVVSSGNNDYYNALSAPACSSAGASAGNTTLDAAGNDAVYGYTAGGSNSASFLSLLAPGTHICSSVTYQTSDCGWTGTSMAAPHVTGAFAALKELA